MIVVNIKKIKIIKTAKKINMTIEIEGQKELNILGMIGKWNEMIVLFIRKCNLICGPNIKLGTVL